MSFYVTLPSHANRREFPNNQANWFKIRLPCPLRLPGSQWQVGLSAISLPDTRVNLYDLVKKDGYILSTSWDQTTPKKGGGTQSEIGTARTIINDIKDLVWVVDGGSFMKATLHKSGNNARKGLFKEDVLPMNRANTPTPSFIGKGKI